MVKQREGLNHQQPRPLPATAEVQRCRHGSFLLSARSFLLEHGSVGTKLLAAFSSEAIPLSASSDFILTGDLTHMVKLLQKRSDLPVECHSDFIGHTVTLVVSEAERWDSTGGRGIRLVGLDSGYKHDVLCLQMPKRICFLTRLSPERFSDLIL